MTALGDMNDLETGLAAGVSFLRRRGTRDAPACVFLHGIGSSAASWSGLAQELDPSIDALFWNAPGYENSRNLDEPWPTPVHYAQRLVDLLDALDLSKVILVGHSLGALFAGACAAAFGGRVAAVALLSPALGYGIARGGALSAPLQARLDNLARLGPAEFAARSAPRLVSRPETKSALVARIAAIMSRIHADGYAQAVRALASGDLIADAEKILAPTLVGVGTMDVVTPPANARRLHAALVHAGRLVEVEEAGHALAQENPKATAQLINSLVGMGADAVR